MKCTHMGIYAAFRGNSLQTSCPSARNFMHAMRISQKKADFNLQLSLHYFDKINNGCDMEKFHKEQKYVLVGQRVGFQAR